MKKTIAKYIIIAVGVVMVFFSGCEKMDDNYKDYIVSGGKTYTGKAREPWINAGHYRVTISWLRGDPSITETKIYWNNYADSVIVPIPSSGDTISAVIDNLEEKTYLFTLITYDEYGNHSVATELYGTCYGDKYQASLIERPVVLCGVTLYGDTIVWGTADESNGAVATDVKYTSRSGISKNVVIPVSEINTSIADCNPTDEQIFIRTMFVPSTCLDTFYTDYTAVNVVNYRDITDLGGYMRCQYYDSPSAENIAKLCDNDKLTKFLTFNSSVWVTFQQPNPSKVTAYAITSANDADVRDPLNWTFEGSNDGINWTVLDTRSNEDFPDRYQQRYFTISNDAFFSYYKLDMTNNSSGVSLFQMAEWEIYATEGGGGYCLGFPEHNDQLGSGSAPKDYTAADLSLLAGSYLFDNAAIYQDAEDRVDGRWAWRFAPGNVSDAYIEMNFDVTEASKVTFLYAQWATPTYRSGAIRLEYSTDYGSTWTQVSDAIEVTNDELQLASYDINLSSPVRFRIVKLGRGADSESNPNGCINIDNFTIYR